MEPKQPTRIANAPMLSHLVKPLEFDELQLSETSFVKLDLPEGEEPQLPNALRELPGDAN